MPFSVRPNCRFPVYGPVTYQTGLFESCGTAVEYLAHWLTVLWQPAVEREVAPWD